MKKIRVLLVRFGMVNPQQVDVAKIDVARFVTGLGDCNQARPRIQKESIV